MQTLVDWIVLLLNPITVTLMMVALVCRDDFLPGVRWLTRIAMGVISCGLSVQWLMAYLRQTNQDPLFHPGVWVLKDIGIFLLFFAVILFLYNVRIPGLLKGRPAEE